MHTFLVDFADLSRLLRTGPGLFLGVLGAYFKSLNMALKAQAQTTQKEFLRPFLILAGPPKVLLN